MGRFFSMPLQKVPDRSLARQSTSAAAAQYAISTSSVSAFASPDAFRAARASKRFLRIMQVPLSTVAILTLFTATTWAQLPDGPGKVETQKLCTQCHEVERSISPRQDRAAWQTTLDKMSAQGMKATDEEMRAVLNYLSEHYPADTVPRIDVNKARAIDLESGLSLLRSQAALIIQYREKNGDFKSIDDLKKVPGVDTAKIEARKDRLIFQ
jgi:competence protein ComEA